MQTRRDYPITIYFSLDGGVLAGSLVQTPGSSTRYGQPLLLHPCPCHGWGLLSDPPPTSNGQTQQAELFQGGVVGILMPELRLGRIHLSLMVLLEMCSGWCNQIQPYWMQSSSRCLWLFFILMQRFLRNRSQKTYLFALLSLPSHQ